MKGDTEGAATPVTIGLGLLGRGPVILDSGNGRLWYRKQSWETVPPAITAGVEWVFDFAREADLRGPGGKELSQGDRILLVTRLNPKMNLSSQLLKAGLKPGMRVISIDGKPVDEWDLWQVNHRLKGFGGWPLELEWQAGASRSKLSVRPGQ
jgi:hypothetical protein